MKNALIIFTRVPVPGATKTRLEKKLTEEECAEIHRAMLLDLRPLCHAKEWDTFVYFTPEGGKEVMKELLPGACSYEPQPEVEFGARMSGCIGQVLKRGYDACALVGTDIPELDGAIIRQAFDALMKKDMVIGATVDEGYYLVGMKSLHKEVFENQVYGTGSVFDDTVEKIKKCGCTYETLPVLRDIDEPEDIFAYWEMYEAGQQKEKIHTWECILKLNDKYQFHKK